MTAHSQIQQDVLDFCTEPRSREEIHSALSHPDEVIRHVVRELLYEGKMTTTPDWEYETVQ